MGIIDKNLLLLPAMTKVGDVDHLKGAKKMSNSKTIDVS